MRPNFEKMTNAELTAYAIAHRDDVEPLRVLYSRRTPDSEATWYGPMATPEGVPIEENIRLSEEAIRQRIELESEKHKQKELQKEKEIESKLRQKIEKKIEEKLRQKIEKDSQI